MKKVELVKGTVFEVDPKKRYMLIFSKDDITPEDAVQLNIGTPDSVVVIIDGDPANVKVIEMEDETQDATK